MATIKTSSKMKVVLIGLLIAFLGLLFVSFAPQTSNAQTTPSNEMHGWAFSNTLGWLSLNCEEGGPTSQSICNTTNYAVSMNPTTGDFSGYALSAYYGSISFMASDTASCGATPKMDLNTNKLSGYAKVLSWSECISLSGTNGGLGGTTSYGVSYNPTQTVSANGKQFPGGALTGNAWAPIYVGWLNFNFATLDLGTPPVNAVTVDIKANGQDALTMSSAGGPITLSWVVQNATSCTASSADPAWMGAKSATGGTQNVTIPPNASTTLIDSHSFDINCTDGTSTGSDSVTIAVDPLPASGPLLNFSATPAQVISGGSTTLSWQVRGMTSCTASGDWSGSKTVSASPNYPLATYTEARINITTNKTYTITCTDTASTTHQRTVQVTIVAPTCSIVPATPLSVGVGAPASTNLNDTRHFRVEWSPAGIGFYDTVNLATSVTQNDTSNTVTATPSPSQITSSVPNGQTTINLSSTAPITQSEVVTINGTPATNGIPPCTPATIMIVPTGGPNPQCVPPSTGTPPNCTWPPGLDPTRRPPWEEI